MKKYLKVVQNTWDETFTYRLSFVMWRVRTIVQIITLYFLWQVVLPPGESIAGYSQSLMLTYILGTSIISSFIISNRSYAIADEINEGNLSNFLVRPINYFLYWFSKDIGDKAINIVFSVVELTILFIILRPPLFIQTNPSLIFFSFAAAISALFMYFFFNILLGTIGFFSPETWAPRFIFITILSFFSGGLFPLDILPQSVFAVVKLLPFTYLLFFPLKIYLGQITMGDILSGIAISIVWVFLLYIIVNFAWRRGIKIYTAYGN